MPVIRNRRRDSIDNDVCDDASQYDSSQDALLDQLEVYLAGIRYDKPESRVQADGTISRPQNAFILFRKVYNMMLSAKGTCPDQNNVSRGAASLWNALPQHRKLLYAHKAKEEREWYDLVFPNYQERQRQRRALHPTAPKRHRTKKQPSPSRSSATRSSMESDYVPTSSLRRADRPSRVSKPEPMHVDEEAVKTEPAEMSPDIHHFDMDVDKSTPTVSSPKPSTYHRIDEQFGFRAGVNPDTLPTLAALNCQSDESQFIATEIINNVPVLQAPPPPKKKKSKGKKRAARSIHDDWELTSVQTVLDVDREMAFIGSQEEPMSFLEEDFGIPSCFDDLFSELMTF